MPTAMADAGSLLILTGPPGAGKSTVAALVATDAPRPTVHLHTDSFYDWISTGFVPPHLPAAARQNEVVVAVIAGAAGEYAAGGYDVVLDGVVGPWFLPPFREVAARHALSLSYVVLRPSLDVTLARATARTGDALTDLAALTGMYAAFADLGDLERHVLDTTGQTPAETAAAVRQLSAAEV
jgi:predicted kinase